MNIRERIERLTRVARQGHRYKVERAILKFTEQIAERMRQKGISPKELAEKINVEPPYVSKIMRGTSNFTFDSVIKLCSALDAEFCFHVRPIEVVAHWIEYTSMKLHVFTPPTRIQSLEHGKIRYTEAVLAKLRHDTTSDIPISHEPKHPSLLSAA